LTSMQKPRPRNWHDPRKQPVHGVIQSSDHPTIVFLTVCTKDRKKWLATESVHRQLLDAWRAAGGWRVSRYVIMPDHVHLFAGWDGGQWGLDSWCKYWKALFSKSHQNPEHRWQTGYWDTRLKSYEQFQSKWDYVRDNPVRHNLVSTKNEWPFQGVLYEFGAW
jgi:putative transposase